MHKYVIFIEKLKSPSAEGLAPRPPPTPHWEFLVTLLFEEWSAYPGMTSQDF